MKVVTFLVALLMSLSMTASLFAAENKGKNDVDLIFQSSQTTAIAQPLELALLSEEEMAETEGAWVWVAVKSVVRMVVYKAQNPKASNEDVLREGAKSVIGDVVCMSICP